jgi:hypothetical protein
VGLLQGGEAVSERRRVVRHVETQGSSSYRQMEGLGRALGFAPQGGMRSTFTLDSMTCTASLDLDSGSVTGARYGVRFEGPVSAAGPTMALRRETFEDQEDKQNFVSVEVQVGDEAFDLEVYVDSTAAEPEVKRFLSREEARHAARWLIDVGIKTVRIERDGVYALSSRTPDHLEDHLVRVYDSLITLARGGALRGPVSKGHGGWLMAIAALCALVSGFVFFGANSAEVPLTWLSWFVTPVVGLGSYPLIRPLVQRLVAGHSNSGAQARRVSFVFAMSVGFAAGVALIWLMVAAAQPKD